MLATSGWNRKSRNIWKIEKTYSEKAARCVINLKNNIDLIYLKYAKDTSLLPAHRFWTVTKAEERVQGLRFLISESISESKSVSELQSALRVCVRATVFSDDMNRKK